MKYRIGDVSKLLGISPDLLRYYEKKGVVSPIKDESNDYRYYEPWDINFLLDCLWFKKFGFGIEQIGHIVTDCPYEEMLELMDQKEEEIQQALLYQKQLLRRTRQYRQDLVRAKLCVGKCDLRPSPEVVRYLNRHNYSYDQGEEIRQLSQKWLEYMPFTQRCFEVELNDLLGEGNNFSWGFSLNMDYVREFEVPLESSVVHLPSRPSIHSVFTSVGKGAFSPRQMDYIVNYARQQGLTLCGAAQGNLVCSLVDNGQLTGYFEVWLPVEQKPDGKPV